MLVMNKYVQHTMYARASVYMSIAYIARVVHINYISKHMFAAFEYYSHEGDKSLRARKWKASRSSRPIVNADWK